jgi:hypothetical protein
VHPSRVSIAKVWQVMQLGHELFRTNQSRPVTQHRFIRSSPSAVLDTAHVGHSLNDGRAVTRSTLASSGGSEQGSGTGMTMCPVSVRSVAACPLKVARTAHLRISPRVCPRERAPHPGAGPCRDRWCNSRCRPGPTASWSVWPGLPRRTLLRPVRLGNPKPDGPTRPGCGPTAPFWQPRLG